MSQLGVKATVTKSRLDLLKVLMTEISKMENYPMLNLYFDIKDKEYAKTEALKDAYNQCKKKAEMLSDISGKKIKDLMGIANSRKEKRLKYERK